MAASSSAEKDPYIEFLHRVLDEAAIFLIGNFPLFKKITWDVLETVFAPNAVAKQLALAVALETGMVTINQVLHVITLISSKFSSRSRLTRQLEREQEKSTSQDEWMDLAERIDNIQGNDVWRSDPDCKLYERERISARVDEFVHLMRRRDIFELIFVLRGGIGRNKFGLLHDGLFSKAMAGSKVLVETYHNVVCAALDFVCDAPVAPGEAPIPTDARLAFFNETRHSYGRTALLLSGGAALGFYHVGVVRTLMANRLMPRVLGGSSAGSIVCAMIGTRTDEECERDLFEVQGTNAPGHSGALAIQFFRPLEAKPLGANVPRGSDIKEVKRTWQTLVPIGLRRFTSTLFDLLTLKRRPQDLLMNDTEHFRKCLKINIGDFTFQEAFDRTGRIMNITVTPNNSSDPPRLLNYLTAPHVLVWSAAVASSSLPGVFEANHLMVKDADGTVRYESAEGGKFSDGSMEQDLPMQQLSEMFNVNHFIVSQANPHAVMFASYNQNQSIWTNPITGMITAVLTFLKDRCRSFIAHAVELVGARRIAPIHATSRGMMTQFFTQEYEGRDCDISLIPWLSHRSAFSALMHVLYNPTEDECLEWIAAAERETWKHIPAIKSHIAEEVTLDRCVQRLRLRSTGQKMGERVPSFFISPSLINLGGLNVSDQSKIEDFEGYAHDESSKMTTGEDPLVPPLGMSSGWGGHGLRGNRSSASLDRSVGSGVFIEGEDQPFVEQQVPGEQTLPTPIHTNRSAPNSNVKDSIGNNGYIKTTCMARFYYRKSGSYGDLPRSKSHDHVDRTSVESDCY